MDRKEESTEVSGFDDTACPLAIRLLGSFDARIAGHPLPRLRSRKGQELLALLALRSGRPVDRSWLAGVLWAESGESQALANLRLCLTDLRKALGTEASRLHAPTPRALRLDLMGAWADVPAFDAAILKGDAASLEAATALYRGALLEGCDEEWLFPERQQRAEAYLGALETLAKQALAAGHPARALPYLKKSIAIDPLRASVRRALMQALADTGDHAAVTQVYRDFRLYLHEELHTQPDQETTVLYEELRCDRKRATSPVPPMRTAPAPALPSSMTHLIGREAEVAAVCACLARTRLVTLMGPGGSGKTRLAIAVAQQLRATFAEQVWFVSLAELPNVKRLVEVVRDGLGLPRDQPDPHMQLVRRLSIGPSLLILDNYEHLVEEGARFVEELLADIPSLVCLVTSRRALNLVGETQYGVPALGFPTNVESTLHLLEFSGVRLYVERAAARRSGFQLTLENGRDVAALCAKLEGIPLAIELVAAWADLLTPLQMLTRLEEQFPFPRHGNSSTPERHGSLQAVFAGSYALLDSSEQRVLRCLAVFAGGWTLEAAEAVCEEGPATQEARWPSVTQTKSPRTRSSSPPQTLVHLKRLMEKSLILFHGNECAGTKQPRYQLLELTRQYALEQFSPEQRNKAEQRHSTYFLQQALAGEAEVAAGEPTSSRMQQMKGDRENYYAAVQRLKQTDPDRALLLLTSMAACGLAVAHSAEGREWIGLLAARDMPLPSALQARLYFAVARWALDSTSPEGYELMEKAYVLAKGCDDKRYMGDALRHLAMEDMHTGNVERARKHLEAALEYSQAVCDPLGTASVQQQLIYAACAAHDYAHAQRMAEALLQSGRESNRWYVTTHALEALEYIAWLRQDYPLARVYGEQAMAIYPETEAVPRSNTLRSLSRTATRQGDFQAARDYLALSVAICQAVDDLAHEAWAYVEMATVANRQKLQVEARDYMGRGLRLFDMLGESGSMIACLRVTALLETLPERSALLWSAYTRFNHERGYNFSAEEREEIATAYTALRTVLSEDSIFVIEARSASMSLREVIAYAMESCLRNDGAANGRQLAQNPHPPEAVGKAALAMTERRTANRVKKVS